MLTVVLESRHATTKVVIKSAVFHFTRAEYSEFRELIDDMNTENGFVTLECYVID
jgi:hypothetical protein